MYDTEHAWYIANFHLGLLTRILAAIVFNELVSNYVSLPTGELGMMTLDPKCIMTNDIQLWFLLFLRKGIVVGNFVYRRDFLFLFNFREEFVVRYFSSLGRKGSFWWFLVCKWIIIIL